MPKAPLTHPCRKMFRLSTRGCLVKRFYEFPRVTTKETFLILVRESRRNLSPHRPSPKEQFGSAARRISKVSPTYRY
jgi:hypothetical protein